MKVITSRDNPLYRKLLKLAKDARESRKQKLTLIDGPHLVEAYRRQVGLPELLLVSESGYLHSEIRSLIEVHTGVELITLKDGLFKTLSGVDTPVGIAAIIPVPAAASECKGESCILLDSIQDAGNVGSILRSSAAAGVRDVFLGEGCANVWSPRVLRAAQGAHFRLRIRESVNLENFLRVYPGTSITTAVSGGIPLNEANLSGEIAWIFGSEGRGVDPVLSALAGKTVTIPMSEETESLNVAAAAAICLFATAVKRQPAGR